ncbi:MAG: DUF4129 domain-containing transglutaminase family protein [Aristaeellaceae bacterium]
MAYLLSLGMALTVLGVTGLIRHGVLAALLLIALNAALAVSSLNRRVALGAGCIALFTGGIWLAIGGAGMVVECFRALMLHLSGLTTALPMVGVPFTGMVCVLFAAAGWFVTQRSAGAYPALMLLVLTVLLLWLGGRTDVLLCLLPAVVACVTLLFRAGDEQTSTLRVLPLAVAVTGIAFAGTAAGGAVSEPLKRLAEDIRQRIYDTFFYTQPRDVFTLATEGYYPQGMSQLGGPAEPHDQPVMVVITPRKTYLRGVVKNVYTGRTWLDDIGGRRYLWTASRFDALRSTIFDQKLPHVDAAADSSLLTTRLLQVRMVRDSASTLFVPQRLRQLQPEGSLVPYFNGSSEVFATTNLQAGDVWTMEAALFTSADSGLAALVEAAEMTSDPNWTAVCDDYLQLHDHIDQRVYEMAAQVTAGADTPYAKAMAIQQYLAGNYAYRLDVAEQPANQDFVSTFLIETKEGYCTYFATAMTVMCRMVGLPARYVEGYVAYPDEEGLAVVTGQEGHAWTEVYFRGFGWVTFDATPIRMEYIEIPPENAPGDGGETDPEPEPSPEPSEAPPPEPTMQPEDTPTSSPEPAETPTEQSGDAPDDQPGTSEQDESPAPPKGIPWSGLLILLLVALMALRWLSVQPDMQAKRQKSEFRRWLVYAQATNDALRRHGFVRDPAETPAAFLHRAAASGRMPDALVALAEAQNLMFYGHVAPYAEETAQARACFKAVYGALKGRQKLLFQLQRMCLPARHFDMTKG